MALDITVTQPELIHALEMQIGQALGAFVVENRRALSLLCRISLMHACYAHAACLSRHCRQ